MARKFSFDRYYCFQAVSASFEAVKAKCARHLIVRTLLTSRLPTDLDLVPQL